LLKLCVAHLELAPKGVAASAKADDTAVLPLFSYEAVSAAFVLPKPTS
jgi:hypothetical protein